LPIAHHALLLSILSVCCTHTLLLPTVGPCRSSRVAAV
jgi:hypothetical protein